MPLKDIKPEDIASASIVPWEVDENLFGISWDTSDGRSGSDLIGSRADAEAELGRIRRARRDATSSNVTRLFPKDIAAS